MRKILLTALVLGVGVASAQYYYIPNENAGTNPKGLNNDNEYPWGGGIPSGWTLLMGAGGTTPEWSAEQNLPFNFDFNGAAVTSYLVSNSGIVTFDVATTLDAPSYTKSALPHASIPDKSVCIWGINGQWSTYSRVVNKVFGSAPNRQLWITFSAFGYGATSAGNTDWTFWSIVLEETTNRIYVVDQRTGGFNSAKFVSIGVQIDATTASTVGSSVMSLAGTSFTPSDNTYYEFIQGVQPAVNIHLVEIAVSKYMSPGQTGPITGRIRNLGSASVASFDIEWTDGTNTHTTTVNGPVNTFSYKTFSCNDQVDPVAGPPTTITVTAVIANDADLSNNSLSANTTEAAFTPTKRVFGEEATGTWCGWCPRGAVWMDYMAEEYPETWVGVAVHNSDPMVVSEYDSWIGGKIGGYPSGLIDRGDAEADPSEFEAVYNTVKNSFGVADISVDALMKLDRSVEVKVNAHFAVGVLDEMRLAAVVIEDNVTGTGSSWSQANYYSHSSQNIALEGAGHDWQAEPNPVPYSDMEYDHVGRMLLGGINGTAGSVGTVGSDETVTQTYNFILDEDYNHQNIHIAGILIESSTGHVMNTAAGKLAYEFKGTDGDIYIATDGDTLVNFNGVWTSNDLLEQWDGEWVPLGSRGMDDMLEVSVYPNPTKSTLNIKGVTENAHVNVYDTRGVLVLSTNTNGGQISVDELSAGVYTLSVEDKGQIVQKRFTVVK